MKLFHKWTEPNDKKGHETPSLQFGLNYWKWNEYKGWKDFYLILVLPVFILPKHEWFDHETKTIKEGKRILRINIFWQKYEGKIGIMPEIDFFIVPTGKQEMIECYKWDRERLREYIDKGLITCWH